MATTTTFDSPTALGAKIIPITHTVTNTSGAYSSTIQDARITPAMQAIKLDIDDPSVFRDKINVACNNGSVTISCNDVVGSTSVKISVIKVDEDPTAVTSIEFDVLNNKITKLSGELAVVIDGNKTAIGAAEGDYVLLKNSTISGKDDGAYTATKAIPANTVIDATYLSSIIDKGIANALNSNMSNWEDITSQCTWASSTYFNSTYQKVVLVNKALKLLHISFMTNAGIPNGTELVKLPSNVSIPAQFFLEAPDSGCVRVQRYSTSSFSGVKESHSSTSNSGETHTTNVMIPYT